MKSSSVTIHAVTVHCALREMEVTIKNFTIKDMDLTKGFSCIKR